MGSVYIAAVYVTYLLIGVGLLAAISISPFPNIIAVIGGLLVIVLGVVSVKDFFFPGRGFNFRIPSRQWRTIARWVHKASIPSMCVTGFLVALFEFPCTGGVYVAILGMLAVKASRVMGVLYLLVYNVAFILPLIVLLGFASNRMGVERLRGWQREKVRYLRLLLGLFMMALGVWILFYIPRYSP